VLTFQDRHHELLQRAAKATTDLLDAMGAAQKAGAAEAELQPAQALHRKAHACHMADELIQPAKPTRCSSDSSPCAPSLAWHVDAGIPPSRTSPTAR
jgi:hypothetical protein